MKSDNTKPFVIGLLILQAGISVSAWLLNSVSINSTTAFALLLAADVLIFAGICHIYFAEDNEAAERTMFGPAAQPEVHAQATPPLPLQPLVSTSPVISHRLRLAVPLSAIAVMAVFAGLVLSGHGTSDVFIPVFLVVVVVYVLSAIYFFKTIMDKEKESTGTGTTASEGGHEGH